MSSMIEPHVAGYAAINGINLYHEVYGAGDPLVLLPGGLMTIPEMNSLLQPLATAHQVIAVEPQGHGRTADTDRPLSLATMGDDIAALLDHLGIERATLVGYSHGADVALHTAFQHPNRVRRLVVISTPFAFDGWYPEARKGMAAIGRGLADQLENIATGKFAQQWPEPHRFGEFLDKLGQMKRAPFDWSAEVRKLTMPVMLIYADHDSIPIRHVAEFFALLGGGIAEPGWQNTKFTNARLAIVPGYSHYNMVASPELPSIVLRFLADPMSGASAGAAAASKVASPKPD